MKIETPLRLRSKWKAHVAAAAKFLWSVDMKIQVSGQERVNTRIILTGNMAVILRLKNLIK